MKLRNLAASTAIIGSFLALPSIAYAQQAPSEAGQQETVPQNDSEIIVTGSRIFRGAALESPVPVTTVTSEELLSGGNLNIGEALNNLPSIRSTYSQANSGRFIGTSGLNFIDLRGLGVTRTLTLVNGRRHITSSPGDYIVDTNTIPDDLLERVDIATGGNSAVYGSDAIAGVLNFVLKRDFQGISVKSQGGISKYGDRGQYFGSITAGQNFGEGRGNIAFSGEYSRANQVAYVDRDWQTGAYSGRNQFNLSENVAGEPAAGNGIPDNQFYNGVRNGSISDGGLITAVCNTAVAADRTRCRASGYGQRYVFDNSGNLVISNPSLDFRDITAGGSSNTVGGLGSTLNNTGLILPKQDRYSANLLLHYDFSPAFKPFLEAKYVRINTNQEGQPSFWQGSIPSALGGGSNLRCNNPFLTSASLATLQSIGYCANAATGTFNISRFNVDFGGRGELHRRETYRVVGGVEGTFNDDWHYEVAVNYGRLDTHQTSLNNLKLFDLDGNPDGFLLASNAVVAPSTFSGTNFALGANGQKVICAVNAVSNARPDCVPINVFGSGAPSAAALAFVNTTATRRERATEFDVTASVTGDLSQLFELPGGPIAFSLGGEYRRETAWSVWDPLTASGGTFLNAIQPFYPPALAVKEAFGEVRVPLLKNKPFFEELTFNGAVRVSDYNTATGSVWSYNAGVYWAPIHDVRIRGSYGHAVRAPTQSDLYSTASQNYGSVADPCDVLNINAGSSSRAANCAAAGVPTGFVNTTARSQTLGYLSGGNPNLQAETSNSWTVGAVFEPSFLKGFSATVDYYSIDVRNLIATPSLQTIVNQCYDLPQPNQYCQLLNPRDATTHEFASVVGLAAAVNFARETGRGIDVDLGYTHTFASGDRFNVRGILTYVTDRTNYTSPSNPKLPDRQLSELGDPQINGNVSLNFDAKSGFNIRYSLRYVGKMTIGIYEAQNAYAGNPPQNADQYPVVWYPERVYQNIRIGMRVGKKYEFYVGVDNLFNQLPPYGSLGTGAGSAVWDNIGRYYFSGFTARF